MSFRNLEQRFNETVNELYAAAKTKFEEGIESGGFNDDPLITRRVGDGYWGFGESRSVPIRSSALDVQRITKFYLSQRGLVAYGKQQLLQTGNTFEFTRLLNPTFAIGNAVPFLHVRRHLTPELSLSSITSLVGVTDASTAPVEKWGQMQVSSYNTLKDGYIIPANSFLRGLNLPSVNSTASGSVANGLLGRLKNQLIGLNPLNAKRNIGEDDNITYENSRPELLTIYPIINDANKQYINANDSFINDLTQNVRAAYRNTYQPFLKYFTADGGTIRSRYDGIFGEDESNSLNARNLAEPARNSGRRLRYLRDPLNEKATGVNVLEFYNELYTYGDDRNIKDDPILVSFAMGANSHVQFRAFIRDLTQSVNPEYKSYQYIGRTERFITYTGIEREINFKLDVLAFSKDELYVVWKRINYLTGMAFPYGVNRGILQPNIMRFTIGNVFVNQFGYISSFSTQFNEITESWDLDREVPIGATVNMGVKIIEKRRMDASQPFYGITEIPDAPEPIAVNDPNLFEPTYDAADLGRTLSREIPISPPSEIAPPSIIRR